MKGHKIHPKHMDHKADRMMHARKSGGRAESPESGTDEAEEDLKTKAGDDSDVKAEAKEMKAKKGGRMRKAGGAVSGGAHRAHGGRVARKDGGSACESDPFTSARHGTPAPGRKLQKSTMD